MEGIMATAVRISEKLTAEARRYAQIEHRSMTGQIEYWATIGKCAIDNPDLSFDFIKDVLVSVEELDCGEKSEYKFG
ncbi:hypothetical protein SPONN_461 [uncultured Candidatus Thioglobus sp.]|nr:hypothetical protein SPONN_461 [uncultured Candidatus Thioglobus sp.]